jgi:hypothetical protein
MAVFPPDASFEEFKVRVLKLRGPLSDEELLSRWEFSNKVRSVKVHNGEVAKALLPKDEQNLSMRERADKIVTEAKANGMDPVPVEKPWS